MLLLRCEILFLQSCHFTFRERRFRIEILRKLYQIHIQDLDSTSSSWLDICNWEFKLLLNSSNILGSVTNKIIVCRCLRPGSLLRGIVAASTSCPLMKLISGHDWRAVLTLSKDWWMRRFVSFVLLLIIFDKISHVLTRRWLS